MPQSLSKIYIHLVFHVKYNPVTILENDLPQLFAYIDGIILNNKGCVIQIGGIPNHIHILCTLPRTISMASFVEEIKKGSSKWIKTINPYYSAFAWQGGYGVFSVSQSNVEKVRKYILNQKHHHQNQTFEDEYISFLDSYQIEYNKDYIFKD